MAYIAKYDKNFILRNSDINVRIFDDMYMSEIDAHNYDIAKYILSIFFNYSINFPFSTIHYIEINKVNYSSAIDNDVLSAAIQRLRNPHLVKLMCKNVVDYNNEVYKSMFISMLYDLSRFKFTREVNTNICNILATTGNDILVYAEKSDRLLGTGTSSKNPMTSYPSLWRGDNHLGFMLMLIRDMLDIRGVRYFDGSTVFGDRPLLDSYVFNSNVFSSITIKSSSIGSVYQWQYSVDGGINSPWVDIVGGVGDVTYSGFTTDVLSLGNLMPSINLNGYRIIIDGVASPVATLYVSDNVLISASVTCNEWDNGVVIGTIGSTIQWQYSSDDGITWNNIDGTTNPGGETLGCTFTGYATPTLLMNNVFRSMDGWKFRAHIDGYYSTICILTVNLYHSLIESLHDATYTAGSTWNMAITPGALQRLVTTLSSYLSDIIVLYPFVGSSSISHSFNLMNPSANQITWHIDSSIIHNVNGVEFTGDKSYGNTGLYTDALNKDNKFYALYLRNIALADNTKPSIVGNDSSNDGGTVFYDWISRGTLGGQSNIGIELSSNAGFSVPLGSPSNGSIIGYRKTGSSFSNIQISGHNFGTVPYSTTTAPHRAILMGYRAIDGIFGSPSVAKIAFLAIGNAVADAGFVATLESAIIAFQTAMGRNELTV